ncbi:MULTISPECIES: O-antigen ligase family protein [Paenibacillus]|uniref:O-antigen ligase family protein n=1 Tax=Paenibacillus TaxID=44249 RepID=UPI0022B8C07E|nr:hypothetical protein [Paenibacillus caseinilyticus]MCZ8523111.1 hypothetical protein [Paenibacillus caseinilyticus]
MKTSKLSFYLYIMSVFLIPLSPATKLILGMENLTWVDPSLILCMLGVIILIMTDQIKVYQRSYLILSIMTFILIYFIGALINGSRLESISVGEIIREPLKLLLCLCMTYLTYVFTNQNEDRVTIFYYFGTGAILQFCFAVYLILAYYLNLPLLPPMKEYIVDYVGRQSLWITPPIPRLGGTFIESPPFGLYMLVVLFCATLFYKYSKNIFALVVIIIGLLGAVFSLADQILVALLVSFCLIFISLEKVRKSFFMPVLVVYAAVLVAVVTILVMPHFQNKIEEISNINQSSVGERTFHILFSLKMLFNDILTFLIGLGPGLYGKYATTTGYYPDTVTPQVTIIEILVETGVLGFAIFACLLVLTLRRMLRLHSMYGIAVFVGLFLAIAAQATWKWSSVFFLIPFVLSFKTQLEPTNLE